jgi:hypothetical protein
MREFSSLLQPKLIFLLFACSSSDQPKHCDRMRYFYGINKAFVGTGNGLEKYCHTVKKSLG